ncbi:MAG: translation initiation factor eIF-2B [Candidatus Odinarchaeota archaeon]
MGIQNIQEIIKDLREDNTSGASEFIDKTLEIIKAHLNKINDPYKNIEEDFLEVAKQIINTRPSMAPLINTIGFLIQNIDEFNKNAIKDRLNQFNISRKRRKKSLKKNFHRFIAERKKVPLKIMLISYSSTIINLLLKNKNLNFEIYVLESRPLFEGRKVAETLSLYFKTHLIIDAVIGYFIDEIDLVLIGVDSILKDGSIINKVGTYPLCVLANARKIEVYVVCDSYKYNLKSHYGYNVQINKKPLVEVYNKEIINKSLEVHNYYFDITPPEYISGIISELGILSIDHFLEKVEESLPIEWFKYFLDNKEI